MIFYDKRLHANRIATALSIPPAHSLEMNSLLAVLMQRHFRTSRTELLGEKKSAWKRMKERTFFACMFVLCRFICLVLGNRCRFYVSTSPSISFYTTPSHSLCETPTQIHTRVLILVFDMKMYTMLLWNLTIRNENKNEGKIGNWNHNTVQSVYYLPPKLPLKYLSTTKE